MESAWTRARELAWLCQKSLVRHGTRFLADGMKRRKKKISTSELTEKPLFKFCCVSGQNQFEDEILNANLKRTPPATLHPES